MRDLDASGRPSSFVRGHVINLTIEATQDTTFVSWIWMQYQVQSGTITFFQRDSEQKLIEMKFVDAYLFDYKREFSSYGDDPFTESFKISAKEYQMGSCDIVAEWPET